MMDFFEWYEKEHNVKLSDGERERLNGSIMKERYDSAMTLALAIDEAKRTIVNEFSKTPIGKLIIWLAHWVM